MNRDDRRRRIGPPAYQERFDLTGDFLAVAMLIAALFLLVWARPADAAAPLITVDVPVVGELPVENVDGSVLTDLAAIRVHYGLAPGDYSLGVLELEPGLPAPEPGDRFEVTIRAQVPAGAQVFIAGTAVDAEGNESVFSNEVTRGPFMASNLEPGAPVNVEAGEAVIVVCPAGWTCTVSSAP